MKSIKDLPLHDSDINNICIDVINKIIKIEVELFVDLSQNYKNVILTFKNVSNINLSKFKLDEIENIEIYGVDILREDGIENVSITFLVGFGKPNLVISFNCTSIHIVDW